VRAQRPARGPRACLLVKRLNAACRRTPGFHGGADPRIVAEFVRYVREGGTIATSPVAARYSVAAGCMATRSLREGGVPMCVPDLDPDLHDHFERDLV